MKPFIMPTRFCGFTIIELLIVVAILAITAGLSIPSLQSTLAESRAQMYMKSLSRDIAYIRSYAVSYGTSVTICPLDNSRCSTDWSKNITVFIDHNMDRIQGGNDRLLKILTNPRIEDTLTYPRKGLTFRSDGSINGFQSGTFRYCPVNKTSQFSKGLVVNQAGRSRFRQDKINCK
jgi:prepilin-type N-terminal cleavage/methylation domain-containing protein